MKIAIASGKGGTGKTTVATYLFHLLNLQHPDRALLVDCDVEEPNDVLFFPEARQEEQVSMYQEIPSIDLSRCTFCRKCTEYCEFNAIVVIPPAGFAEINPNLCHSCGACLVACESEAIRVRDEAIGTRTTYRDKDGNRIREGRLKIGSAMQTLAIRTVKGSIPKENSILILDAPPGTSCPVVETISDADYILLVTEPTPFGLHDLALMLRLVRKLDIPFGVVINKAGLGDRKIYTYLRNEEVEIISEIPFNLEFASQYARAELFDHIPGDIEKAHLRIAEKLKEKGLIP